MASLIDSAGDVPGYAVPVHRALTEHILLGGAPVKALPGTVAAVKDSQTAPTVAARALLALFKN